MENLKEIYERITLLRHRGVKMKDMAEMASISPSVLSAIYSTVLPTYLKNREKELPPDEALSDALKWVNNVSKKKLLGSIANLKSSLFTIDMPLPSTAENKKNLFLSMLEEHMNDAVAHIANYTGIYMSYSLSSGNRKMMKIEPYLIAPSANGGFVEVGHNNAYGATHWGIAMLNEMSHIYLMFNEFSNSQLALFNICLKIPMFEHPPFLKGIYTCLDYNYNPVARRILFMKQSEDIDRETFMTMKGELKPFDKLNEKEQKYYDYTCQPEDIVSMCNIPSPKMTEADLALEKIILSM